ncbi:MAG: peptidylprolyl isomerase [Planctomycetota bacterium]|nr:MAG: peptidylprolyl isomerase [Planctomycetota bacterium]
MGNFGCQGSVPAPAPPVRTAPDPAAEDDPTAPQTYQVRFHTTKGDFVVEVHRDWAPRGADRFYRLVNEGFYDNCAFFRIVPNFVVQFGINGDPSVQDRWRDAVILDDPVKQSNRRGTITFATSGPHSRTTQVFINLADNGRLDEMGFAPFGEVIEGMDVVDSLNAEYGERPDQSRIQFEGNAYLKREFPRLDYILTARVVAPGKPAQSSSSAASGGGQPDGEEDGRSVSPPEAP